SLVAGGVRVHAELAALRRTGRVVALGEDPVAASVLAGLVAPNHDEVSPWLHGDARLVLVSRGVGVHLELATEDAGEPVALGEDSVARAVLAVARPHDDDARARSVGSQARLALRAGRVRIDSVLRVADLGESGEGEDTR